jgi:small subunit ribosomal protein S14
MAKVSAVQRDLKRRKLTAKYAAKRAELKVMELADLPRNSAKIRNRNRCALTGRPRAHHRKFRLSRIAIRDLASRGELPGVTKASW